MSEDADDVLLLLDISNDSEVCNYYCQQFAFEMMFSTLQQIVCNGSALETAEMSIALLTEPPVGNNANKVLNCS